MTLEALNTVLQVAPIIVLGVTFLIGAGALWTSYRVNKRLEARIATIADDVARANERASKADQETARLTLEVAEANVRAEKDRLARVELERRTAVRSLTTEQRSAVLETALRFAGQHAQVMVFPVTFEGSVIASTIVGILSNARWSIQGITYLTGPPQVSVGNLGPAAPMLTQGLYIQSTRDQGSKEAGRALFDALRETVASGVWSPEDLPIGPPRVWILVGDRPTPLSTWVQ